MAVYTLRSKKTIGLVHKDRVVDGHREIDVARMAGARCLSEVTCRASITVRKPEHQSRRTGKKAQAAYGASPQEPSAGSYKPPGTGLRRLSKVLSFSMRRTEMARISSADRKENSTLSTEEETGCEIFMLNSC